MGWAPGLSAVVMVPEGGCIGSVLVIVLWLCFVIKDYRFSLGQCPWNMAPLEASPQCHSSWYLSDLIRLYAIPSQSNIKDDAIRSRPTITSLYLYPVYRYFHPSNKPAIFTCPRCLASPAGVPCR